MKVDIIIPQEYRFVFPVAHDMIVPAGRPIVLVQCSPSLHRNTQITSVSRLEDPFKVGHYRYCSGFGVRVVDMRVETQPICTNSSQIELVPGGLRTLKKFLGTVSSWTKQV